LSGPDPKETIFTMALNKAASDEFDVVVLGAGPIGDSAD
jgi:threonine dehydrogenase-like Zn-dependent dehydrogenase